MSNLKSALGEYFFGTELKKRHEQVFSELTASFYRGSTNPTQRRDYLENVCSLTLDRTCDLVLCKYLPNLIDISLIAVSINEQDATPLLLMPFSEALRLVLSSELEKRIEKYRRVYVRGEEP